MEISIKQLLESEDYVRLKEKISKERNWGDPYDRYLPNFEEFKKSKKEKEKLYNLKMEWRSKVRRAGFTKRNYKGQPI